MDLYPVPGNEIPAGLRPGGLTTPDGVSLRYAVCTSGTSLRGTVCIFPGRAEFIERYFETIRDLKRRGYAVAILDWRGQGGSQRPRHHPLRSQIGSFKEFDTDLAEFMTGVVLPDCPPPYFGMAHSTGGNILLRALRTRTWFDSVVISAPLIRIVPRYIPEPLARMIVRAGVGLGLGRVFLPGERRRPLAAADFPGNPLTSDKHRYMRDARTLEHNPHLGLGGATFSWLNAAMASMDDIATMPSSGAPRCPVLLVASGLDRIVSSEATRQFARRVPNVAAVVIERARHEILHERDELREQFWAAFDSFIEQPQVTRSIGTGRR